VYFISRRYFGFSREWAAPLASGISICGVSAAIATGSAIRARPDCAHHVSSLVVIFSVIELMVLPFAAQHYYTGSPWSRARGWGLPVKTDGAAVASGGHHRRPHWRQSALPPPGGYQAGWIMGVSAR